MKRNLGHIILAAFLLSGAGATFAHPQNQDQSAPAAKTPRQQRQRQAPKQVSVDGTLAWVKGRIALQSGDITYYVHGIDHLLGFVDALKDGAQVKLEGRAIAFRDEKTNFLAVQKVVIGDKEYVLQNQKQAGPQNRQRPLPAPAPQAWPRQRPRITPQSQYGFGFCPGMNQRQPRFNRWPQSRNYNNF
ncbi:hypothetical protein ACYULU_03310 [Breznakiellaceae bacterium SP9]